MLSPQQRNDWMNNGFFVLNEFVEPALPNELLRAAEAMADRVDAGESIGDAYTVQEKALAAAGKPLSMQLSKIFRVHRTESVFRRFAMRAQTLDPIRELLGDNVDCFLSQFIFKLPGALGQPHFLLRGGTRMRSTFLRRDPQRSACGSPLPKQR